MTKKSSRLLQIEHRLRDVVEPKASLVKESVVSRKCCIDALKTVALVLFYYIFSISLTFYNKKFISTYKLPLSITMTHLVTKFILALIVREIFQCIKKKERVTLGWGDYVKRVAPPGIASSLDIALSNWSFEYITVSLYTMTKTTVIIFILLFSILFKLEKAKCSLVLVVFLISGGLFMFTFESTQFNLLGFLLVFSASVISGLRWTLSQIVLQKDDLGLRHPVDMMYHMQPWMILALMPLSTVFEGVHLSTTEVAFGYRDSKSELSILLILFAGAFIAFGLEMSEFLLVSYTSSLTLSVGGIVKEIIILLIATLWNGDKMNALNSIGLVICLLGIIVHVLFKSMEATKSERVRYSRLDEDSVELLVKNGNAVIDSEDENEFDVFNVQRDRASSRQSSDRTHSRHTTD